MVTSTSENKTLRGLALHSKPLSFAHIKQIDALNSELADWLKLFAFEDVYHRVWEFDGNAVIDDCLTMSADATATAFAAPAVQVLGGALKGSTGTTDNGGLSMIGTPVLKGDNRAYFHTHFKLSAITNIQFEVGLVDAVTDKTLPVVSDVDTPANGANGAADFAVVHLDTDQALKTAALVVDGSTAGMACVKENLSTFAPTADTYVCVRVFVDVNNAWAIINNNRTYRQVINNNIEGGVLLAPWLFFATKAGSANRDVHVDLLEIAGERA